MIARYCSSRFLSGTARLIPHYMKDSFISLRDRESGVISANYSARSVREGAWPDNVSMKFCLER
jgi:hypothetical protein